MHKMRGKHFKNVFKMFTSCILPRVQVLWPRLCTQAMHCVYMRHTHPAVRLKTLKTQLIHDVPKALKKAKRSVEFTMPSLFKSAGQAEVAKVQLPSSLVAAGS
jgi:hypothetical protein